MSSGDDQRMDTDADEPELQRNRKEESALSVIPSFPISDFTDDSLANEKTLSPITPELVQALYSEDVTIQIQATQQFRILLKTAEVLNERIDEVIKSGTVPRFVHFCEESDNPKLQMKSVYVLAKIASGNSAQRQVVLGAGAVPVLDRLLFSPIANAAVLTHACWTLSRLCDGPNEQIQGIIKYSVCPRAVQLLSHTSVEVVYAALLLVGNIAKGNASQTRSVINKANALPVLGSLLSHEKKYIVKEDCRIVAIITASNERQIQAVMDANIIPSLIGLLHHQSLPVRRDASEAIANATANGSDEQNLCIVEAGVIPPLCKLLSQTDSDLIKFVISGLVNILRTGESFTRETGSTVNPFANLICNSPSMKRALYSENTAIQLDATKRFGKLLGTSKGINLLGDQVIKSDTVPRFVHFLEDSRYPELQNESVWVLTNLAIAQTQVVIDAGAVPLLIGLVSSSKEYVVANSVQALGCIACDSTESRDLVLNSNVLLPLLGLFNRSNLNTVMMRPVTWALSRLCWGNPHPNFEQVPQCLPLLTRLMVNEDADILAHACLALAYLGEGSNEKLQAIIKSGVFPRAVQLLGHSSTKVVEAALRLVFIIITGDDSQTQILINANALPAFGSLLLHEKESIVMEACLTLASITAESEKQIQAVIDANLIHLLIELLRHGDIKFRQSAAWVLANATSNGSEEQIVYIVEAGVIAPLGNCLYSTDMDLIEDALICLENILRTGKGMANSDDSTENRFATFVKQWAGFDKIAYLLSNNDQKIKETALNILRMLSGSKLKYISDTNTHLST